MYLSKTSNGRYYIYFQKSDNRMTRISTKTKKKSEAVKFLSEFEKHIKFRQLTETIPISLTKFRWEFLKYSEANHAENTTNSIKIIFKQFIEYCNDIPLIKINQTLAKNYIQSRAKVSSYKAQKHLAHLRKAFNFAIDYKYVLENPFRNIDNYRLPEKQPLFFDEDSFTKLLDVIDNDDFKDIVIFAVHTGLRQMEILTLEWNQINFKDRMLILSNRKHITKSKKIRTIPLSVSALQILTKRDMIKSGERVFTYNDKPYNQFFVSKKFKNYIRKTDLNPSYKFHSLRHTFASWLVQRGVSIYYVSKLLGHADIRTTEIYTHLNSDDLRDSIDLLTTF